MIHLDTHSLLWHTQASPRLGEDAKALIEAARWKDELFVSSIVFWEVALLVSKKRLTPAMPCMNWREAVLRENIREIALTGNIGIYAVEVEGLHADPADRLIAATAILENATLITADKLLLNWKHPGFKTHDATL